MEQDAAHGTPATIEPFRVDIPQDRLDDLAARLRATRFAPPLPDDGCGTGVPDAYLRSMVSAWAAFDWRAYERRLADVPQFTTEIDGQRIHFIHVRSRVPGALPLLLTHGWPGSSS
ncbi:epoxide hydrolase N-terminal domain-containing protein [Zafaria sp. Z1313]|uniref:epoxide hydrolase N-terminal domain-containing protein n=1 Tax=unclassified Zafaria TaxID=2828765 RepID=UPI002E7712AA|nr:epoxide hydrolase N-terminal domain-containing protein [Zafaria sp. J156]MEE1621697.1 epoxide hydrolase N-terminal domain-containing protein [Zafaria sp. J156]